MKKTLLAAAVAIASTAAIHAAETTLIFSEDMGTPTGTTSIAANTFENSDLVFSGTADVRNTTPSSGYSGASGGGNILINSLNETFIISGIDTTGFEPASFTLTFGAYKNFNAGNIASNLTVSYSTDGLSFTSLSFPAQPTGSGTNGWRLLTITNANLIPVSSTLTLRFQLTNASDTTIRIDDVTLSGVVATVVPEPHEYALAMAGLLGVVVLMRRRKAMAA